MAIGTEIVECVPTIITISVVYKYLLILHSTWVSYCRNTYFIHEYQFADCVTFKMRFSLNIFWVSNSRSIFSIGNNLDDDDIGCYTSKLLKRLLITKDLLQYFLHVQTYKTEWTGFHPFWNTYPRYFSRRWDIFLYRAVFWRAPILFMVFIMISDSFRL